jgi:rhodanese-related sulfurtransferase
MTEVPETKDHRPSPVPVPSTPPVTDSRPAVDRVLDSARRRISPRVQAAWLESELAAGALVVDTRPLELRARDGDLPGAAVVERNVLEWRLDPTSPHRLPQMATSAQRVILVCDEGYASSLAAVALLDLGLTNVTDLEGGFQAWRVLPH